MQLHQNLSSEKGILKGEVIITSCISIVAKQPYSAHKAAGTSGMLQGRAATFSAKIP